MPKTRKQRWERREEREKRRLLREQYKTVAVRAKYGPSRRPSAVTVRSLDTGEVLKVVDQSRWRPRVYSEQLDALARAAGYEGFADYIASPYWQSIRERVLERDGRRCQLCGGAANLTVHHDRYEHVGDERLRFLKTICAPCHRHIHRRH